MGFTASIVTDDTPYPHPVGAQVRVFAAPPWGVSVDWRAPVTKSDSYREKLRAQDASSPLLRYVLNAKEITRKALLDILTEAGFRTLIDHQEQNSYLYRVLEAPKYPLN